MAKTKSKLWAKVGVGSCVVGLLLAIIISIATLLGKSTQLGATTVAVLAVLGVIVGLLNISDEEVQTFLLASVAFVVASTGMAAVFATFNGAVFESLQVFMNAIAIFTAPGALVVAFKALYNVAKDD